MMTSLSSEIPITGGYTATVDRDDYWWLSRYKWHIKIGYGGHKSAASYIEGKSTYMHRLIMKPQDNIVVDHINRNPLDNRKQNLRLCSKSQNEVNSPPPKNNKSGYKGVYFKKKNKKYCSQLGVPGKRVYLGLFDTSKEAALAYNKAAKEYFGGHAWLNSV